LATWRKWWTERQSGPISRSPYAASSDPKLTCIAREADWGFADAVIEIADRLGKEGLGVLREFPRSSAVHPWGTIPGNLDAADEERAKRNSPRIWRRERLLPNFRSPYVEQANTAVERQFGSQTALSVGYVYSHGLRLLGDSNGVTRQANGDFGFNLNLVRREDRVGVSFHQPRIGPSAPFISTATVLSSPARRNP
jgi:hypothetical protein